MLGVGKQRPDLRDNQCKLIHSHPKGTHFLVVATTTATIRDRGNEIFKPISGPRDELQGLCLTTGPVSLSYALCFSLSLSLCFGNGRVRAMFVHEYELTVYNVAYCI